MVITLNRERQPEVEMKSHRPYKVNFDSGWGAAQIPSFESFSISSSRFSSLRRWVITTVRQGPLGVINVLPRDEKWFVCGMNRITLILTTCCA